MRITNITLHYLYVPYQAPVDPYWGWQAPCHGAHAVIVEMETDAGIIGWGETAGREVVARHQQAKEFLVGRDPLAIAGNVEALLTAGHTRIAISGLEMAMWDLLGKVSELPLYQLLGGKVRECVPLCGLMGVKPPEEAYNTAKLYLDQFGFRSIKTKAGRALEEDIEIAQSLGRAVGAEAKLRFDANQSYTAEMFRAIAPIYESVNTEYFEQPFPVDQVCDLITVCNEFDLPIALNESVTDAQSAHAIGRMGGVDCLVCDLPESGGILEMTRLGSVATVEGMDCAFHSWHDLGLKTAAMAHLVSAIPAFNRASDTTYHGLAGDVIAKRFEIADGSIVCDDAPGLGVEVSREALIRFRKPKPD